MSVLTGDFVLCPAVIISSEVCTYYSEIQTLFGGGGVSFLTHVCTCMYMYLVFLSDHGHDIRSGSSVGDPQVGTGAIGGSEGVSLRTQTKKEREIMNGIRTVTTNYNY